MLAFNQWSKLLILVDSLSLSLWCILTLLIVTLVASSAKSGNLYRIPNSKLQIFGLTFIATAIAAVCSLFRLLSDIKSAKNTSNASQTTQIIYVLLNSMSTSLTMMLLLGVSSGFSTTRLHLDMMSRRQRLFIFGVFWMSFLFILVSGLLELWIAPGPIWVHLGTLGGLGARDQVLWVVALVLQLLVAGCAWVAVFGVLGDEIRTVAAAEHQEQLLHAMHPSSPPLSPSVALPRNQPRGPAPAKPMGLAKTFSLGGSDDGFVEAPAVRTNEGMMGALRGQRYFFKRLSVLAALYLATFAFSACLPLFVIGILQLIVWIVAVLAHYALLLDLTLHFRPTVPVAYSQLASRDEVEDMALMSARVERHVPMADFPRRSTLSTSGGGGMGLPTSLAGVDVGSRPYTKMPRF